MFCTYSFHKSNLKNYIPLGPELSYLFYFSSPIFNMAVGRVWLSSNTCPSHKCSGHNKQILFSLWWGRSSLYLEMNIHLIHYFKLHWISFNLNVIPIDKLAQTLSSLIFFPLLSLFSSLLLSSIYPLDHSSMLTKSISDTIEIEDIYTI